MVVRGVAYSGGMNTQRNEPRTWTVPEPEGPRSLARADGAFVLVNGWQLRYDPEPEHRAAVTAEFRAEHQCGRSSGPNRAEVRRLYATSRGRAGKLADREGDRARLMSALLPGGAPVSDEKERAARNRAKAKRRARR
jgi:hypothetical protein